MSKTTFDAQSISNSLRAAKHQPRKRFGQNFLHDRSVIREIVESIRLERDDNLIEIGPGMGALTEPLLAEVDAMTVVELDRDLAELYGVETKSLKAVIITSVNCHAR